MGSSAELDNYYNRPEIAGAPNPNTRAQTTNSNRQKCEFVLYPKVNVEYLHKFHTE